MPAPREQARKGCDHKMGVTTKAESEGLPKATPTSDGEQGNEWGVRSIAE